MKTRMSREKPQDTQIPRESAENLEMQRAIRNRANLSLGILGKSFITNGSGRFVDLRVNKKR